MDNGKPREGQLCRLVIDGYASDGAGVARLDGMVVFVQGGIRADFFPSQAIHKLLDCEKAKLLLFQTA